MDWNGRFEVWNGKNTDNFLDYEKIPFHSVVCPDAERLGKQLLCSAGKHAYLKSFYINKKQNLILDSKI